jgi:hypothetical protein
MRNNGRNRRIEERNKVFAKAVLVSTQVPGTIHDMNTGGLRVDWISRPRVKAGQEVRIKIIPIDELGLPTIEATVQVRWSRQSGIYESTGLQLVSLKNREMLNSYKKLLSYFSESS